MQRSTVALLLLVLAACGGPAQSSQAPAEPSDPGAAEEPVERAAASSEERLVSLLEGLAADLPPAGECGAYADTVDRWTNAHAGEVRELARQTEGGSELEQTELARLERRLETALQAVLEGADACTESEPAQAAFAGFDELMLGG